MKTNAPQGRWLARRAGGAASAALALMLLAGCTGGSTPIVTETPTPTLSASPSPSSSPSPSPLTDAELLALMPPDAAYPDVRGAIATAEFFLEQYDDVYATGNLEIWDALSMPSCTFCASIHDKVEAESVAGDFESGNALHLDTTTVVANFYSADGFTYVTFQYVQDASVLHHPDGSTESAGSGGSGSTSLRMTLVGTVWRVDDVGIEPA